MQIGRLVMCVLALGLPSIAAAKSKYRAGQVWEYRTRPGDDGSLVRIQKVEASQGPSQIDPIYHVSVIGVHFHDLPIVVAGILPHMPVSRETLDKSVTKLSKSKAQFPDVEAGISEWRANSGGVFTVSLAEAVGFVETTIRNSTPQP
jgi:hypothetical protein